MSENASRHARPGAPVSPIAQSLASKPETAGASPLVGDEGSDVAQLYVKPPQLRRNATVIKVSNLRIPREQTWCTFSGLRSA
jgi:hypothetical protein